jgi:CO/xanthine dehydrogenase FAD-binding subunit
MRAPRAEELINGKPVEKQLIENVALQVGKEIDPPAWGRTSQEYRRHMVAVMFRDGFWRAWEKAGGEE